MKKMAANFLIALATSSVISSAHATDLMDIYNQALQSDQVYQAAKFTRLSNREALPQSVAALLPQFIGNANTTGNKSTVLSATPSAAPTAIFNTQRYNSNGYTLTLTQPLFNFANWMTVSQANATAKQADATFAAAGQDLIVRVAQAYFNVLQAEDQLSYTQAQKAASAKQLDQVQERFKVGLDAITSVYDAQAQYDSAVAQEIGDQNTLQDNKEALRQLTGEYYNDVDGLKIELPLITPQPENVEQWVSTAEKHNLNYMASRYATQAARANVKINAAGHLPTVSAVGTYAKANGANTGTTDTVSSSAGLQVTVPIFSGGLVLSQTRQAEDDYATASANMENTYRQTIVATRQKYNDVLTGISKIKADRQAIVSAQSSLDSTQESFKVGTRTIVDVLISLQNLYKVKRIYAQDEYQYINDTLALKEAAGALTANDLQAINTWLHAATKKTESKISKKDVR
jgi:outer membrane protein